MRTTIDLPEGLLRRARAEAAIRGIKFKELISRLIEQGLEAEKASGKPTGQHRPIPVRIPPAGRNLKQLSNETIERVLIAEDMKRLGHS